MRHKNKDGRRWKDHRRKATVPVTSDLQDPLSSPTCSDLYWVCLLITLKLWEGLTGVKTVSMPHPQTQCKSHTIQRVQLLKI